MDYMAIVYTKCCLGSKVIRLINQQIYTRLSCSPAFLPDGRTGFTRGLGTCRLAGKRRSLPELEPGSPADVALWLPVRQSGMDQRNQTVEFSVGTEIPAMKESCADSISYANLARTRASPASGPKVRNPDHVGGPPALPRGVAGAGQAIHTGPPEESCIAMRNDPVIEAVREVRHRTSEPSAGLHSQASGARGACLGPTAIRQGHVQQSHLRRRSLRSPGVPVTVLALATA